MCGSSLDELDCFSFFGGALRVGRIFNRHPASVASGNSRDLGRGRLVPEFPWESVAVPVAKWMGVSSDQFATTFPYFNGFECTVLVPVEQLSNVALFGAACRDWYEGAALMSWVV